MDGSHIRFDVLCRRLVPAIGGYGGAMDLGTVGVWWSGSLKAEGVEDVAGELEALGYGAIWSSGGFKPGLSSRFESLLASTSHLVVASGIVSVWASDPKEIAGAVADLEAQYPGRFLLGLGASHAPVVENYSRPYSHVAEYLDTLDSLDPSVPKPRRALAALGPRMLELAAQRSLGAHPYFVPVEHTHRARQTLGDGPLLAPEVTVVLEADPGQARELARTFTRGYLALPNYANNLRTLGYGDDDVAGAGSDRLVDAVVAWGDIDAIGARVRAHHHAGADHVCIQVVSGSQEFPIRAYRELAAALLPR
jgi:probable F420-dependent oxidoreductase